MSFKHDDVSSDLFDSFLAAPPKNETLERLNELISWKHLRTIMAKAYENGMGREGFDPVLLFKLMLLEQWYRLSDRDVVFMACDSISFRKFLALKAGDKVPDDTTLVKFRNRLRSAAIFDELFAEISRQMNIHGLSVKEGSICLIDATLIAAAPSPPTKDTPAEQLLDPDASFTRKYGQYHYGYKLHVGQDRQTGLIVGHKVTTAKLHDSQVFEQLLGGKPSQVLADKAYDNNRLRAYCRKQKIKCGIMHQPHHPKPLSTYKMRRNIILKPLRAFVEGVPATLKRHLRCARALYLGLERVTMQLDFGVLAFNLRRYTALARGRCA